MSFYLLNTKNPENDYTTGKRIITAHFECDTVSDLPALVQSTYIVRIGSTAHIIENNSKYAVKSDGTWCVQETGTDVYTKSEVDNLLLGKANNATTLAGYGIINAYTKAETNAAISNAVSGKITLADVFGIGSQIETGTDLNNITTRGLYTCNSVTIANSLLNTPISGSAFRLEVKWLNNSNRIRQECYILSDTSTYYARTYTSTGWKQWFRFEGVPV
jgi:hypothetical protein